MTSNYEEIDNYIPNIIHFKSNDVLCICYYCIINVEKHTNFFPCALKIICSTN